MCQRQPNSDASALGETIAVSVHREDINMGVTVAGDLIVLDRLTCGQHPASTSPPLHYSIRPSASFSRVSVASHLTPSGLRPIVLKAFFKILI